jgi:hypothetical protein
MLTALFASFEIKMNVKEKGHVVLTESRWVRIRPTDVNEPSISPPLPQKAGNFVTIRKAL